MDRGNKPRGNFALGLIWFVLIAATGVGLLIMSLVVWLSALTGSMIAALLIVSGICFLLAGTIYFLTLRETLSRIQHQIDTVYEVARAAHAAYEWLTDKLHLLASLWIISSRGKE